MRKILHHKWHPQDGFRTDKCEYCDATRKWDEGFQRIIYYTGIGTGPFFWAPNCKRIMHSDKVAFN